MSDYNKPIRPIITGAPGIPASVKPKTQVQNPSAFGDMLKAQLERVETPKSLTLSKHAQLRAQQRGINLTETDMERLDTAARKAQEKGINDTLVMMDSNAFIINVPNRVVVTMVDQGDKEAIFTNIDGAVIV